MSRQHSPAQTTSLSHASSQNQRQTIPRLLCKAVCKPLFYLAAGLPFLLFGAQWAQAQAPADATALVEKGRYLAVAGDCMACHTAPKGGQPFAGGYGIDSPLGRIYSTNITPSKSAGIGNYSELQFRRALRQGVRADGVHLYPAMPYTSYTLLSDDDVHALYTYFMQGVKPVDTVAPPTTLPFPFNMRASMMGWNLLFLKDQRFVPQSGQTQQITRGDYLTNALAHCSACHTPRNALMAEDNGQRFAGAPLGPWYAPNISSDPVSGIGAWSDAELTQYLRSGHAGGKNQAAAGMAEAVQNSLQFLSEPDVSAIVAYLRSTKPIRAAADIKPAYEYGRPHSEEAALRGLLGPNQNHSLKSGASLYSAYCASCHQATGSGSSNQAYPSLFHNTATGSTNRANLIATMLYGVERKTGDQEVLMPRFDSLSYVNPLTSVQIAAIANYVLEQYGNPGAPVTAEDVDIARAGGPRPLLAQIQPYILPLIGLVAILFIVALALVGRRKRRKSKGGAPTL
jgi:fructose 5-dehydrogenase cytochrome subunit